MRVKVDNRTFEEILADERRLVLEESDLEEMLSEEEINQRVSDWFVKHRHEWKPSHIPDLPAENGLSGEEFEEVLDTQLKNENYAGLAKLCRYDLSPSFVRLFKKLAIISGYTD